MKLPLPSSPHMTPQKVRRMKNHKERMTVGQYLLKRLESLGVDSVFGKYDDTTLRFLKLIEHQKNLRFIETEAAANLADGYTRAKGIGSFVTCQNQFKSAITTFYHASKDSIPLITIFCTPEVVIKKEELRKTNEHFLDFNFRSAAEEIDTSIERLIKKCFLVYSVLDDAGSAAKKIDRTLDCALHYQKPVCIELPERIIEAFIPPHHTKPTSFPPSDPEALRDAITHLKSILQKAHKPFICIGREVLSFKVGELVCEFAEKLGLPISSTIDSRSTIDEEHPLFFGTYSEILPPALKDSDTALFFGTQNVAQAKFKHTAILFEQNAIIDTVRYPHVSLRDIVSGLAFTTFPQKKKLVFPRPKHYPFQATVSQKITLKRLVECTLKYIHEYLLVMADEKVLAKLKETPLPQGSLVTSTKSTNFTFSACLGASFADLSKRQVAILSESDFQASISDFAVCAKYNLKPIIITFSEKNHTHILHYKAFPELFGKGKVLHVTTEESFEAALKKALKHEESYFLIEVTIEKNSQV